MKGTNLDGFLVSFLLFIEILQFQSLRPSPLVQIQQHPLLRLCFSIIYRQAYSNQQ